MLPDPLRHKRALLARFLQARPIRRSLLVRSLLDWYYSELNEEHQEGEWHITLSVSFEPRQSHINELNV
jgi:hypothetical protein